MSRVNETSKLSVEMTGNTAKAEVFGSKEEVMFNWATLTNIVCQETGIPPAQLAIMLPGLLDIYKHTALKGATKIDLSAIRNIGKEGRP